MKKLLLVATCIAITGCTMPRSEFTSHAMGVPFGENFTTNSPEIYHCFGMTKEDAMYQINRMWRISIFNNPIDVENVNKESGERYGGEMGHKAYIAFVEKNRANFLPESLPEEYKKHCVNKFRDPEVVAILSRP